MKKLASLLFVLVLVLGLAACGSGNADKEGNKDAGAAATKDIKIGATAGPYADMVNKAIKPQLEKMGYTVETVEFSDYIQPNISLGNGSLDANLFQHKIYMESFAKEKGLNLSEVIVVPTAPMGIYSKKYKSLDEIADGTALALPNDPTNMARAMQILVDAKLIEMKLDADPLVLSEKDVAKNPKNIQFKPLEAAQLPRATDGVDLSAVPGNYALAADMNLLDALALENMPDQYRNRVVVDTKNIDTQLAKDLKAAVESPEFEAVIDSEFQGFGKPEWMKNRK